MAPPRPSDRAYRLGCNFTAQMANQACLTELASMPTSEGWLYLATVIDLFTRKLSAGAFNGVGFRRIRSPMIRGIQGRPRSHAVEPRVGVGHIGSTSKAS